MGCPAALQDGRPVTNDRELASERRRGLKCGIRVHADRKHLHLLIVGQINSNVTRGALLLLEEHQVHPLSADGAHRAGVLAGDIGVEEAIASSGRGEPEL